MRGWSRRSRTDIPPSAGMPRSTLRRRASSTCSDRCRRNRCRPPCWSNPPAPVLHTSRPRMQDWMGDWMDRMEFLEPRGRIYTGPRIRATQPVLHSRPDHRKRSVRQGQQFQTTVKRGDPLSTAHGHACMNWVPSCRINWPLYQLALKGVDGGLSRRVFDQSSGRCLVDVKGPELSERGETR